MGKIFRVSLILLTIMVSSYSLSFGDQAVKGNSPRNSSNDLIYEQGLSHQKGDPPFLSLNKAGFGFSLYEGEARKAIGSREVSMNPEITNSPQSSATNEFQNKELSDLENTRLSKGKPRYHLGKIYLTKDNHDPSLSFISRLSAVEGEEKNPLFRALENSRGNGIFKSLAIFWELELNF